MSANSVPLDSKGLKDQPENPAGHEVDIPHNEPEPASSKRQDVASARQRAQDKDQDANAQTSPLVHARGRGERRRVRDNDEILRFRKSERFLHWAIAIPFMVCWVTALILVVINNPDPSWPLRAFFAVVHRIAAVGLILLPAIVVLRNRKDYKVHLYNIKCAWLWTLNDLKWLSLMGIAAVSKRIVLPEQGKFNAAEKVNFMMVMVACPMFILTGLLIWVQEAFWLAWLFHASLALLVTPAMLGHIYMATVNPETRAGLKGMISGYVDRQWARHHYELWYREFFEDKLPDRGALSGMSNPPDHHVRIHCPSCTENMSVSWTWLLHQAFAANAVYCPTCGAPFESIAAIPDQRERRASA